jgi:hypothetical protein
MAKYSYINGMEDRGLNWVFIPIVAEAPSTIKAGRTSQNMKNIQNAFQAMFGSTKYDVVILENYVVPDGRGQWLNAILFYDQNDARRLTGDGIRFHDGAQDLPVKRKP